MKLLIADDHTLFKDTLAEYIKRTHAQAQIRQGSSLKEALDLMEQDPKQDIVLLDLRMPGMNGLEGIRIFREKYPNVPVGLMSGLAEEDEVEAAMNMGVSGYFPKTLSGKALVTAIQLVVSGEEFVPIDSKTNRVMPSHYGDQLPPEKAKGQSAEDFGLTPRETETLSYLLQGAANKEIANALGLQVVTVKLHVRGICKKLGVQNRTQAALKAKELGLLRAE